MESGTIVEYIDRQKILCAVVIEARDKRLRLLNENNREINLSTSRLSHLSRIRLDLSQGRDHTVHLLKETAKTRDALIDAIDIRELWEVLNEEQEWIDLVTMTELCFPGDLCADHESAVVRAFFRNRLYFKFNSDRFFPNTEAQVEAIIARQKEARRREKLVAAGGAWLNEMKKKPNASPPSLDKELIDVFRSYFLYEKESPCSDMGKAILSAADMKNPQSLFPYLVRLGVFSEDENIDLLRNEIPVEFSPSILASAERLVRSFAEVDDFGQRKDLTHLNLITIDGQSTLDFDDAISIEADGDRWQLGIHIADVGHFVPKGSDIDVEAAQRGTSIYMPDQKVSMLPASLADGACSLKAGEIRPAISVMVNLSSRDDFKVVGWEITASRVRISRQLTYYDANLAVDQDRELQMLRQFAESFRKRRLADDAVQISLPEVHVWIDEEGRPAVNKINRESPGRMLVAEIMILANWIMAKYLSENGLPAVFRSQPKPRERLFKEPPGSLFQNIMQRRHLNRFVLGHAPESHAGLGLDAYVTATSPIRKYFDLITQRQIRAGLGLETPYTTEEIDAFIVSLHPLLGRVMAVQRSRTRFWLLKYLETQVGKKEEALVLVRHRAHCQVLLIEYMIECDMPMTNRQDLKPESVIQVVIQRVDARKNVLSVFLG